MQAIIDPNKQPLYNSRVIDNYIKLIKKKYSHYIISWEISVADSLKKIRNFAAILLPLTCLIFSIKFTLFTLTALLPVSAAIVLLLSLLAGNIEKAELKTSLNNLKYSTDQLVDQININYNNALMTNEIGQAISSRTSIEDILSNIVQISKKRLDYDRCMIFLADSAHQKFIYQAGYGFAGDQSKFLRKAAFNLHRPGSRGISVK